MDINKILDGNGGLILSSDEANYLRGYVRAVQEHSERHVKAEQEAFAREKAQLEMQLKMHELDVEMRRKLYGMKLGEVIPYDAPPKKWWQR